MFSLSEFVAFYVWFLAKRWRELYGFVKSLGDVGASLPELESHSVMA